MKTNRAHDAIVSLLQEIAVASRDADLFDLYDDDDMWVQIWAAAHTLEVDENRAAAKLQSITEAGIPLASMTAEYTLQQWHNGSITFRT